MATFDSKTIVMMAENGHSVEIEGQRIQFTIVQESVDVKPDEVRVFDVPSEIKISKCAISLNLHFGEYQYLWYNKMRKCYGVATFGHMYNSIPCIATECKFEDLKEGDLFFATNDEKPDFTTLNLYNFLNNDKWFAWTDGRNVILNTYKYNHYFKITPKP